MSKTSMLTSAGHTCQLGTEFRLVCLGECGSTVTWESEETDLLHCLWSEGSWGDRKRGVLCEGKNCDPKKQQFEGNSLGFSFSSVTCKDSGTVDIPIQCSGQGHLASEWEKYLSGWGPSSLSPLHAWGLWYWILDSFLIDSVPFLVSKLLRTDFLLET